MTTPKQKKETNKQIDIITDLLIDFDEMGFSPTTIVPDPDAYALDWKNRLINALQDYHKQSEGHWFISEYEYLTCSECGEYYYTGCDSTAEAKKRLADGRHPNYCPNCGAKMSAIE